MSSVDKALDSLSHARTALDDPGAIGLPCYDGVNDYDPKVAVEYAVGKIDEAMRLLGPDDEPEPETGFWIHKHEVGQQYGGPEEGGWYYEAGSPVAEWTPIKFLNEDRAYEACRALNADETLRAKIEESYEYTSVLAHRSTHYAYRVEETPVPAAYPSVRPHYE